ncbi:unnamed protein product, partial [Candidula unifasciata]
ELPPKRSRDLPEGTPIHYLYFSLIIDRFSCFFLFKTFLSVRDTHTHTRRNGNSTPLEHARPQMWLTKAAERTDRETDAETGGRVGRLKYRQAHCSIIFIVSYVIIMCTLFIL